MDIAGQAGERAEGGTCHRQCQLVYESPLWARRCSRSSSRNRRSRRRNRRRMQRNVLVLADSSCRRRCVVVAAATANWQHNAARLSYAAYELCMQQARAAKPSRPHMCVCPSMCVCVSVSVAIIAIYSRQRIAGGGREWG